MIFPFKIKKVLHLLIEIIFGSGKSNIRFYFFEFFHKFLIELTQFGVYDVFQLIS